MTTQVPFVGKDMLLYIGDGASPEVFSLVGGMRSNSVKINQAEIDVTTKDGSRWRKLITGGIRSVDISGAGVFEDDPQLQALIYKIMNTDGGYRGNFRVAFVNGLKITGPFILKTTSLDGPHDKDVSFSADMASAGDMTLLMAAPTVTAISPATGAHGSTHAVAITGSGFLPGATVLIGADPATSVVVVDGSHITAVVPIDTAGTKDVTVTNIDTQAGVLTNGYVST